MSLLSRSFGTVSIGLASASFGITKQGYASERTTPPNPAEYGEVKSTPVERDIFHDTRFPARHFRAAEFQDAEFAEIREFRATDSSEYAHGSPAVFSLSVLTAASAVVLCRILLGRRQRRIVELRDDFPLFLTFALERSEFNALRTTLSGLDNDAFASAQPNASGPHTLPHRWNDFLCKLGLKAEMKRDESESAEGESTLMHSRVDVAIGDLRLFKVFVQAFPELGCSRFSDDDIDVLRELFVSLWDNYLLGELAQDKHRDLLGSRVREGAAVFTIGFEKCGLSGESLAGYGASATHNPRAFSLFIQGLRSLRNEFVQADENYISPKNLFLALALAEQLISDIGRDPAIACLGVKLLQRMERKLEQLDARSFDRRSDTGEGDRIDPVGSEEGGVATVLEDDSEPMQADLVFDGAALRRARRRLTSLETRLLDHMMG